MTEEVIRFTAQIYKVQTIVDGGVRITLDLPETAIETATEMMKAKQAGALLQCACVAVISEKENIWQDQQN